MVHLADIHRHPVKGWTPESLDRVTVQTGGGLPFDRHFAFTSGNREELPVQGGWVQARTFLQLTVFPELAALRASLDEDGTVRFSAPDCSSASARAGEAEGFDEANAFIRKHFAPGPHGAPYLVEQAPGYGHWDFTDTCISLINLQTVAEISKAAGQPLERERFRGNLYVDDLPAWEEFAWPGRVLRIGDVELEVLRPIQRCAMTSTEPGTGKRAFDLPAIMNQTYGHNFCGVYARVVAGGELAAGAEISVGDAQVLAPYDILPERVALPLLWPRFVKVEALSSGQVRLTTGQFDWPLIHAQAGQGVRVLGVREEGQSRKIEIVEANADGYVCNADGLALGTSALINGPVGIN